MSTVQGIELNADLYLHFLCNYSFRGLCIQFYETGCLKTDATHKYDNSSFI